MPLTPATTAVPTSEPFNFGVTKPSGGRLFIPGTVNIGVLALSETVLLVYQNASGDLVEYSMVNGDPGTASPTGNVISFLLVGIPTQMAYDRINLKIYYRNLFTGVIHQIDMVGETLAGASISPISFTPPTPGGWTVGMTGDSLTLFISPFASQEISRYDFAVPGDVSSLALIQQQTYALPGVSGYTAILPSGDGLTLTLHPEVDRPMSTIWLGEPKSLLSPPPTVDHSTGKNISLYPFKAGTGLTNASTNPSGTKMYLSALTGTVVTMFTIS